METVWAWFISLEDLMNNDRYFQNVWDNGSGRNHCATIDGYPLRTKKAREFEIWKAIVLMRYRDTAGGMNGEVGDGERDRVLAEEHDPVPGSKAEIE